MLSVSIPRTDPKQLEAAAQMYDRLRDSFVPGSDIWPPRKYGAIESLELSAGTYNLDVDELAVYINFQREKKEKMEYE